MSLPRVSAGTIVIVVGLLVLVGAQVMRSRPAETPVAFGEGLRLQEAVTRADQEGRVVVAVASATWCGPCQSYKRGALSAPEVTAWLDEHAVAVYVDVDKHPEEASLLGVRGVPATYVIRGGELVDSRVGLMQARGLLQWLEGIAGSG